MTRTLLHAEGLPIALLVACVVSGCGGGSTRSHATGTPSGTTTTTTGLPTSTVGGARSGSGQRAHHRFTPPAPAPGKSSRRPVAGGGRNVGPGLPTLDVPLSPAPYRGGDGPAALRVVIDDPVLGQRQAIDIRLQRVQGRWIVDRGANALFTVLPPRPLRTGI